LKRSWIVSSGAAPWYCENRPCTEGEYVFLEGNTSTLRLLAHEYIHVLQYEGRGYSFHVGYAFDYFACGLCSGAANKSEAPAYLWEAWMTVFAAWEASPWQIWRRPSS